MIAVVAAGWRYVPQDVRAGLLGAIGIAASGDRIEVKHFIEDVVLPKDPAARRGALTSELEKNIAELKSRIEASKSEIVAAATAADASPSDASVSSAPDAKIRRASSQELIGAAAGIIKELESVNKDASVGQRVIERILDTMLPAPSASACPVK